MKKYILSVSKPQMFGLGEDQEFFMTTVHPVEREGKKGLTGKPDSPVKDPNGKEHREVGVFCRFPESKITDVERGVRIRVQLVSHPDGKTLIGIGTLHCTGLDETQ
jgi:hypothetical protein